MAAASPTTSERATRLIAQLSALFEDVAGTEFEGVDPATHFVELGLDSLSLTQVALQLQKTFALKITFRELMESCSSFESLAQHIDRLLPPETVAAAATSDVAVATVPATSVAAISQVPLMSQPANGGLIQDVIQQQMLIMQQQLALLAQAGTPAAMVAAPPPVATPATATSPARRGADGRIHSRYAARRGSRACAYDLRRQKGVRRDRTHPFQRNRADRAPTRPPRCIHAPLHRAHAAFEGIYPGTSPALGRSARGQRIPSAAERNDLPDRGRSFQGLESVGPGRQRIRRCAERLRHEPVRLAAGLRLGRGTQTTRCRLRDRPAASAGRRRRQADLRAHRLRSRRAVQYRLRSGDGNRCAWRARSPAATRW